MSITKAARDAIPGMVRALGTLPPLWRAITAIVGVMLCVTLAFLAVRYDYGGAEALATLGSVAAALVVAALGAATDQEPRS